MLCVHARVTAPLLLLLAAACDRNGEVVDPDVKPPGTEPVADKPEVPSTGLDGLVASIDKQVDPCVDFYQYACGGWLAAHELPADKPRYGRSFDTVSENNEALLHELLDAAAAAAKAGGADPRTQKLGDYYN